MNARNTIAPLVVAGVLSAGLLAPALNAPALAQDAGRAKNVIIIMGDGMGPSHRLFGQLARVGPDERLAMDSLPVAGLMNTVPDDPDSVVTDSAASATAFFTGVKTANGHAGTGPDGAPLTSILELAKASGKSTGFVTSSGIVDASLAAFASHVADRDDSLDIARQYVQETQPDVMLGGGEDYFYPAGDAGMFPDDPDPEMESQSIGELDLISEAEAAGYTHVSDAAGLAAAPGPRVLGLFANEDLALKPDPSGQGYVYEPTIPLAELTAKGIELLSQNPEGFVLFVEEDAGLDTVAHDNNADVVLDGMAALDAAVAVAKQYAEEDGETLLIVLADHETGGLQIEALDIADEPDESGVEADDSSGISGEDGPFQMANDGRQFMVDWTTHDHTAVPVPVTALGPGADALTGIYENTHVFDAMVAALGLDPTTPAATPDATPAR